MNNSEAAQTAAWLCMDSYAYPKATYWQTTKVGWQHTLSKTIPLKKNLIGKAGAITLLITRVGEDVFITFSGTDDAEFWLYNLDLKVQAYWDSHTEKGFGFHKGFFDMASEVVGTLNSISKNSWPSEVSTFFQQCTGKIYWCGHSAGAAVAGICSILVDKNLPFWNRTEDYQIIDFGSPRYISQKSQRPDWCRTRFQEALDLVACTPLGWRGPLPGFRHYGEVTWIDNFKTMPKAPITRIPRLIWTYAIGFWSIYNIPEMFTYHSMTRYLASILKTKGGEE